MAPWAKRLAGAGGPPGAIYRLAPDRPRRNYSLHPLRTRTHPTRPAPLVQKALGDRYRLHREIGRGGAARVFLAEDPAGTRVALKVLHPELQVSVTADRFLREIKLVSRIDHPLVARVLDSGEADWLVYYVMPFIDGPTLRIHLDSARRLSVDDTIRLGRDLLGALGRGAPHRHRTPRRQTGKCGAFGQGRGPARFRHRARDRGGGNTQLTRSGITVGTSHYMSPEQVQAVPNIDHRTDLYSVGCLMFESLAGHAPFRHPNEVVVLQMHLNDPAPDVRTPRPDAPGIAGGGDHEGNDEGSERALADCGGDGGGAGAERRTDEQMSP